MAINEYNKALAGVTDGTANQKKYTGAASTKEDLTAALKAGYDADDRDTMDRLSAGLAGKTTPKNYASTTAKKATADKMTSALSGGKKAAVAGKPGKPANPATQHSNMVAALKGAQAATAKPAAANPAAGGYNNALKHANTASKIAAAPKTTAPVDTAATAKLANTTSRNTAVRNDLSATTYPAKRKN